MRKNRFWMTLLIIVGLSLVMQTSSSASERLDLQNLPDSPNWKEGEDLLDLVAPGIPHPGPKAGYVSLFQNQKILNAWGYGARDVDEIKDLLPKMQYEVVRHPEIYGDYRINETAYIPWRGELWEKYQELTEKYKGTCRLSEKNELLNYKAGCPFPEPKNGNELVWNLLKRFRGDDRWMYGAYSIYDREGNTRNVCSDNLMEYFDGRIKCPPAPVYEPNPKGLDYILTFPYISPYDLQGTIPLVYGYRDADRGCDMWLYSPYLRRVRRMSVAQRQDRVPGGLDFTWDGWEGFLGTPYHYTWTILGRKEMLASRNAKMIPQLCLNGYNSGCNQFFQRVNAWVLKGTAKNPVSFNDLIIYLDPEIYWMFYLMQVDTKGRDWIWMTFYTSADKNGIPEPTNMNMIDVQRRHASRLLFRGSAYNQGHHPSELTMDALRREYPSR